jgi:hypothetical protein
LLRPGHQAYLRPSALDAGVTEKSLSRLALLATVSLIVTATPLSAQTPTKEAPAPAPPAAAAPPVEAPNSTESMEDAQLGDHWTYEFRDDISGDVKSTLTYTVTDLSDKQIGIRITKLGTSNNGDQTFDRSWNLMESGSWRYAPNDGTGIPSPLAVGKTWSFKSTDLNNTAGLSVKRSGTSKVVAQESVTTQAGTFETFKIETSFQMQNANDPTAKVQAVAQTWYAPAINHWVKRSFVTRSSGRVRDKNTVELVEYGRR